MSYADFPRVSTQENSQEWGKEFEEPGFGGHLALIALGAAACVRLR